MLYELYSCQPRNIDSMLAQCNAEPREDSKPRAKSMPFATKALNSHCISTLPNNLQSNCHIVQRIIDCFNNESLVQSYHHCLQYLAFNLIKRLRPALHVGRRIRPLHILVSKLKAAIQIEMVKLPIRIDNNLKVSQ